jgi:DNA-binding SARP family transcriptional activator
LQAALEAMRAEPLRETPHRLIVQVHLAEGNAYEALHAFYAYRQLILSELQLEPSLAMRALLDDILAPLGGPTARTRSGREPYSSKPPPPAPRGPRP